MILNKINKFASRYIFTLNEFRACTAIATTSSRLISNIQVESVFSSKPRRYHALFANRYASVIGWGRKPSGLRASAIALKKNIPCLLLEDGYIRSITRNEESISLIVDRCGIFYDASSPSELEQLIQKKLTEEETIRTQKLINKWKTLGVSKYNPHIGYEAPGLENYVLVIDQVRGDCSTIFGGASENSFEEMLNTALAENPDSKVVVKLHPDVYTRSASSHFNPCLLQNRLNVHVIATDCHAVPLIRNATAVYTVTSQVGFEALLWGKPVHTFGMPFYAGWGLTKDRLASPSRRGKASLEQLVHAALINYTTYLDPENGVECSAERALDYIAFQRNNRVHSSRDITAIGFSRWKKPFVKNFLHGANINFARSLSPDILNSSNTIAIWGGQAGATLKNRANVLRIEDGFLRSSGLGADLVRPISLVIDNVGIYFDSTRPSELENILNSHSYSSEQLVRAGNLIQKITKLKLTKYNVGKANWTRPITSRKVVLVVGQVESDASIEYGSPRMKSNLELLNQVRTSEPDAYVIYKPHPDVLAKLRRDDKTGSIADALCDEVIGNVSAESLFSQIDVLHTMTSLMGFEALMRGVDVVCHGLPFYAGWGLTTDKLPCTRRCRQLTIEQLVFGALSAYPRYMHINKPIFIEAEEAVAQLAKLTCIGVQKRPPFRQLIRLGNILRSSVTKREIA